jgi:uncharacterized protein YwgA
MTNLADIRLKAVVASLVENMQDRHGWCGETHIQKTAYFLKGLMGVPLNYNFVIYKHGPYSFDLHDDLMAMKANRFLRTEYRSPYYGPSFKQGELKDVLTRRFPKTLKKYQRQIEFIAEELSEKNVRQLERLGTALFITERHPDSSVGERSRLVNELKPHVPVNAAREAVEAVDELKAKVEEQDLLS